GQLSAPGQTASGLVSYAIKVAVANTASPTALYAIANTVAQHSAITADPLAFATGLANGLSAGFRPAVAAGVAAYFPTNAADIAHDVAANIGVSTNLLAANTTRTSVAASVLSAV